MRSVHITQLFIMMQSETLDLAHIYSVAATISCTYIISCHLDFMCLQIVS